MRKLFSLFLALVATASLWAYDFQSGNLYYNITSGTTVEVTSQRSSYPYNEGVAFRVATIPSTVTYNGTTYSVTSIGDCAFSECSSLTSITIPESVTSIGDYAFSGCSKLTAITIPESVTSIGDCAFSYCSSLTTPVYNAHCFAYMPTSFKGAYVIPEGIKQIAGRAFSDCTSLTSVTIGNSVTSIGNYAFRNCSSLTSIHLKSTTPPVLESNKIFTTTLQICYIPCGTKAAYKASDWAQYVSEFVEEGSVDPAWQILYTSTDGNIVTPYASDVFGANMVSNEYKDGQGVITFYGSVTSIGDWAFYMCSSLTSVTIPESVTSIGYEAFYGCSSLTSITIPNSVTSIGGYAFSRCSSLKSITIPNSVTSIGNYTFDGCSSLTSPVYNAHCFAYMPTSYSGHYTIPEGIKQIAGYAFDGCSSLTSITIPNSVTNIGNSAFYRCYSLTSVTINSDAIVSRNYSHYSNISHQFGSQVTKYIIGESVTSIGGYAFDGCSSLTSVTIPNSVTSIGGYAFKGCYNLTAITIPNSVTSIGGYAFSGCSKLTAITIPESVTSIGEEAFYNCSSLTSITIPNSVTSIGGYAFSGCSKLTAITIPKSVTSIGDCAFYYCSSLTSIHLQSITPPVLEGDDIFTTTLQTCYIPCATKAVYEASAWAQYVSEFVEEGSVDPTWQILYTSSDGNIVAPYKSNVFGANIVSNEYKDGQGVITFYGSVTSIGDDAFYECRSLTSITIPNSVTSIGDDAFSNCSSLTSMVVAEGNMVYDSRENCNAIIETATNTLVAGCQKTIIPESVTSIGDRAFYYCSSLTSITIPNSVTSIGEEAFRSCYSLTSVTIGESVTSIGKYAFYDCSKLTSVTWNAKNCPNFSDNYSAPFYLGTSQITNFVFGDSVEHIPAYLCFGMDNLKTITIPNSVTSIGYRAFYGCRSLFSVTNLSRLDIVRGSATHGCVAYYANYVGNDIIGDFVFAKWEGKDYVVAYLGSDCQITLPENYRGNSYGIGAYLFENNSSVNSITISNAVTSIGDYAFSGCSNLNVVYIGNSVLTIGKGAFYDCPQLYKVIMLPNTVPSGINSAFQSLSGRITYVGNTNYQSGYSVLGTQRVYTNLNSYFSVDGIVYALVNPSKRICDIIDCDYSGATSEFSIGNSVVYKNVTLSIDSININAFRNNTKMTKMIVDCNHSLPSHVASDCSLMDTLIITANVGNIGQYAFQNCSSLENVTIKNNGTIGVSAFESSSTKNPATYVISNVGLIDESAFANCSAIKTLLVDTCVGNIGQYAFQNCSSLENVTINNNGTIGLQAFGSSSTENPATYVISNVGLIDKSAFANCTKMQDLTVNSSVTTIGQYAFQKCSGLENVTIKNNGKIGLKAFEGSSKGNPATYVISNVGLIGESAFANCTALENCTIRNNGLIGESAFANCTKLQKVCLGNQVGNINQRAFYNCVLLDSLTLPNSVKTLGDSVFYNCNDLAFVQLSNTLSSIGNAAFDRCSSLPKIFIPKSVSSIGQGVFKGCTSLSILGFEDGTRPLSLGRNSVNEGLFYDCPLDSVYIGRELTYQNTKDYGYSPFYRSPTLRSIVISDVPSKVETNEFYGCTNLYYVLIGNGAQSIGDYAFSGCSSIDYFSFGSQLQTIGAEAFSDCVAMTRLYSYCQQPPTCGASALEDIDKWNCTLYIPVGTIDAYTAADQWRDFFFIEEDDKTYTITWKNDDGSIIDQTEVPYGQMPTHSIPTKPSTEQYTYTFAGWSPEVVLVTGDATYTATYTSTLRQYTITFLDEDGTILSSQDWDYGTMPTCDIPTKPSTEQYTYTFAGWSPEVVLVTGDATYTATYTTKPIYTYVPDIQIKPQTNKILREDKVFIIYGNKVYTITGQEIQ